MSTGDKTITYNDCASKLFFFIFLNQQNFLFWLPYPMTAMWPSANPYAYDHYELQNLQKVRHLLLG